MFTYLKKYSHYEDLYDLTTIEECIDWYWKLHDGMETHREELKAKEPDVDFDKEVNKCCSYAVNLIKIERYREKKKTISKWIDTDQSCQNIIDNTPPPDEIYCDECNSATTVREKTLHNAYDKNPRVSFIFECTKCKKRQIFYDDGSPWDYKKSRCKNCDVELETKYEKMADISTITTYCPKCSFKEIDVIDSKEKQDDWKKESDRKQDLLSKHRAQFCLSDIDGPEAVISLDGIIAITKKWQDEKVKLADPNFNLAMNLKKLKLNQVKDLITETIKNSGYIDLQFSKPEIGKYVIVDFSVTDKIDDRKEYDSAHDLKKLINSVLQTSNWRLMSDGIDYRLGILTGRIKAYEQEKDLISLVRNK